jgi:hypothetical protein
MMFQETMPKALQSSNTTPEIWALIYQRAKENIPIPQIASFAGISHQAVY